MLNSYASAPPFASYTRPQQQTFAPDHQVEDADLSAALAASLREHQQHQRQQHQHQQHQHQQHQHQQQQQPRVGPHPRGAIEVEAVNGAVQVLLNFVVEKARIMPLKCNTAAQLLSDLVKAAAAGGNVSEDESQLMQVRARRCAAHCASLNLLRRPGHPLAVQAAHD
jgi:hypothetical protein